MKKPDLSKVKDLFFAHGEKIALGICAFLALTFGALSLLKAMSVSRAENSQKTWEQELRDTHAKIHGEIDRATISDLPEFTKKMFKSDHYEWQPLRGDFKPGPYLAIPDSGSSTKRVNPVPLSIRTGDKNIQIEYIRALALTYDIEPRGGAFRAFNPGNAVVPVPIGKGVQVVVPVADPVRLAVPVRMVRVTAAFPMKQQIEEFRRALRITSQKEMLDKQEDLPRFLGLNVVRYQLNEKGEPIGKEVEIIKLSQRSKALDDLMRVAIYDRVQPEVMKKYLYNGLFTPLPTLANAKYRKVELEGFELDYPPEADLVMVGELPKEGVKPPFKLPVLPGGGKRPLFPMMEQPNPNLMGGVERKIDEFRRVDLKKTDESLEKRLFGESGTERYKANDYNITHALGLFPPQNLDAKGGAFPGQFLDMNPAGENLYFSAWQVEPAMPGVGVVPNMPPRFQPMPGVGQPTQQFPDWDRDALVSFIDPDVVPGETYRYSIQVRIANPNYKYPKIDDLAYAALTSQPELILGNSHPKWENTPTITIPHEYSLYAADQQMIDEGAGQMPKKGQATVDPKTRDMTAFQIHLWAKRERDFTKGQDHDIGDVVIAERILVRRGDQIGVGAYVKIASWNRVKNSLDIPSYNELFPKDKKNPAKIYGAFLNMQPTVAGIEEGVRKEVKLPPPVLVDFFGGKRTKPGSNVVEEETAVESLIMTPDGQLFVRNSRIDTDTATPLGREREERVQENRRHFNELLRSVIGTSAVIPGGGINLPGVKN